MTIGKSWLGRALRPLASGALMAGAMLGLSTAAPAAQPTAPSITVTWVAVTTWLIESGGKRILFDGYLSRPGRFAGDVGPARSVRTIASDPKTVAAVLSALTHGDNRLDYILTGHAHFDHSLDIPMLAKLSGAQVVGAPSVCFQVQGEGLPKSRCTPVNDGETIRAGPVTIYAIHSNHSGEGDSVLHVPLELTRPIQVDPPGSVTGGIRGGVNEQMPNGGGTRAYLIKSTAGRASVSLSIESSGSASDFDQPIAVRECTAPEPTPCLTSRPGKVYRAPAAAFRGALKASGLSRVDLLIGMAGGPRPGGAADTPQAAAASLTGLEAAILRPRYFAPTHWNDTGAEIAKGLDRPYANSPGRAQWMADSGIQLLAPKQYLDRWVIEPGGVRPLENHAAKQALGLSDVQAFKPTP